MSDFQQPRLPLELPIRPQPDAPEMFIASALTHLDEEQTKELRRWSTVISTAAVDAARDDSPRWLLRVHQPIIFSHPARDQEHSPQEIHDLNRRHVETAAALAVLGLHGGSMGAGMELSWALSTRQPVLYLAPGSETISRQVLGASGIQTATFTDDEALETEITEFVRSHRARIETHPQRLDDRDFRYGRSRQILLDRLQGLSDDERRAAVFHSRLTTHRFNTLLSGDAEMAGASIDELAALSAALGVHLGDLFDVTPPPDLALNEVRSLQTTAAEDAWSVDEAFELLLAARAELARGGTRRLRLNTPQAWREFRDRRGYG